MKYDKYIVFTIKDWDTYQAAIRFISKDENKIERIGR